MAFAACLQTNLLRPLTFSHSNQLSSPIPSPFCSHSLFEFSLFHSFNMIPCFSQKLLIFLFMPSTLSPTGLQPPQGQGPHLLLCNFAFVGLPQCLLDSSEWILHRLLKFNSFKTVIHYKKKIPVPPTPNHAFSSVLGLS